MTDRERGPCIVCGATGYALSMGGPGICPPCDCGVPPDVTRLRAVVARLEAKVAAMEPGAALASLRSSEIRALLERAARLAWVAGAFYGSDDDGSSEITESDECRRMAVEIADRLLKQEGE